MRRIDTIIIGGGQAGLAMSRCLSDRGIDHVVLERGRVGERWRSERWDSARLLTPNWQSRLPDWYYRGDDPDGFMTMPEFVDYLEQYARSFEAPIAEGTSVLSVEPAASGYRVVTSHGVWETPNVVIATGHCDVPHVPEIGKCLSPDVTQLVPTRYRNPGQLPDGGVLVVGAAASGVQLADEIAASGRDVTLAVGSHVRLPRTYRGRDIMWWLETMGVFLETADEVYSVELARKLPSLQLVGRDDKRSLDLESLQDRGVRLVGRAVGAGPHKIEFANDLADTTARADAKLERLVARIDEFAAAMGLDDKVDAPHPVVPFRPAPAPTEIDLRSEGISTVLWATGFRRNYPWLNVPVLDAEGEIRHDGGVTEAPGLYVLGLRFLRRRNSSFIDGVGNDAAELSRHLASRISGRATAAA